MQTSPRPFLLSVVSGRLGAGNPDAAPAWDCLAVSPHAVPVVFFLVKDLDLQPHRSSPRSSKSPSAFLEDTSFSSLTLSLVSEQRLTQPQVADVR